MIRQQLMLVAVAVMLSSGCATKLDPSGPYNGDTTLYKADKTITESIEILDAFVKWEYENRVALEKYPDITVAADAVRVSTRDWLISAIEMRDAYARSSNDVNRSQLTKALDVLKSAITEAQRHMKRRIS